MPTTPTVALLGTGIMGQAMGRRLLSAGIAVRAWNRTIAKAEPLAGDGATIARSPVEAADGADFLLTMLSDGGAVEQAVADGAIAALGGDAVWLQMSTVGIEATERLAALAGEHGIAFVDAPVLGTKGPAEQGQLTVLASGPARLADRCRQVLEPMAADIRWVGETGAGTRLKLVVNTWLLGLLNALAETIALAERIGVDPLEFLGVIDGRPMGTPYAQLKGKAMVERDFATSFPVVLAEKGRLALEAAGVSLPGLEAIVGQLAKAGQLGHGDDDMAAVVEATRATGR